MKIVIRIVGLALVLAVYFGLAALLPSRVESAVGFVAFVTILIGAFVWAMRDGREMHVNEAIRDWLVVAFFLAVIWWIGLVLFEGSEDVIKQIRLNFLPLLSTAGLIFAAALFGALQGSGAGSGWRRR